MIRSLSSVLLVLGATVTAVAQPSEPPRLRVTDRATGLPLRAARVIGPTPDLVAVTGVDGTVRVAVASAHRGCTVRVSAVGYRDHELPCEQLGEGEVLDVALDADRLRVTEGVVVTGRLVQPTGASTPRAVAVVTADDLERKQPRTTPEALDETAGVWVQKTNHGGGSPIIRGLAGNQILVLVDGIRLNNSTFRYGPNQYLATVDVFSLDRIEIVRGAGSVLFGSDALGGVVNVVSRPPELIASGRRVSGRGLVRAVSSGMEQSARVDGALASRRLGVRGGVTVRRFGDLRAGAGLGVEAPSGYDEVAGDARLLFALSPSTTVSAGWQHVHQTDVPRFDQVRQRGFERWSFDPQVRQLAWTRLTWASAYAWIETASVTGSWHRSSERRERRTRGSAVLISEDDLVNVAGVLVEARAQPVPTVALHYGLDVYHDSVDSRRLDIDVSTGLARTRRGLYPDDARARSLEVFGAATWTPGPFTVDVGGRRTWARMDASDGTFGAVAIRPSATIGSVSGAWRIATEWTIYGVAAQAFRAPNVDDMSTLGAFDFGVEVPAIDLVPERSLSLEAGVRWTADRVAVSAAAWQMALADLIDRVPATFGGLGTWEGQRVYRRTNVGDARLHGVDADTKVALGPSLDASGYLAYAHGEQAESGEPMRRVPPLNGQLALAWRRPGYDIEVRWRWATRQGRLAGGDLADHRMNPLGTPGWDVLDVRGSFAMSPTLRFVGVVGNMFDEAYRVHGSGLDGMGRHLSVALRVGAQ